MKAARHKGLRHRDGIGPQGLPDGEGRGFAALGEGDEGRR